MLAKVCLLVLLGWQLPLLAGVVGDFEEVRNLPGYISLKPSHDVYRDPLRRPRRSGDGVEQRTASRILREDYLRNDGKIDVAAINAKIAAIKKHETVAFMTYCVEKLSRKVSRHVEWCRSRVDEKLLAKWHKRKLAAFYAFAIGELQKARTLAAAVHADNINQASSQAFLEHLFQGLETFASILDQDVINSDFFNEVLYGIDFTKVRVGFEIEAANIVIPASVKEKHADLRQQVFFSPQQLQTLARREGLDIAALDPLNSGFWRKPHSIRAFDTRNYNGQSGFPAEIVDAGVEIGVTYDWGGKFTGRTPKMRVSYKDSEYKMKYVSEAKNIEHATSLTQIHMNWRKHSFEVNTETVVNNLAAAIGYTVDPTFFKRSVRLYLPLKDPTSAAEFDREYQRLLADHQRWKGYMPEKALAEIDTDEQGRWYIRMRSVSLEKRSELDSDISVGGFIKAAFSRPFKREFRAFALFSAWISDLDVKDDNANLVLVGDADGRKVAFSAADMGSVLGNFFGHNDAPNFYGRDMVDRVRRKPDGSIYEVVLNYIAPFSNSALQAISISDAKWITRLIAQLSPQQIKNAFLTAGYSELLSEYFSQIMLRRRDQLVETFGLLGQTVVDGAGTRILLKKESQMTDPDNYAVKGYEQYFKDGYLYDPEGDVSSNPGDFVRRYYDRNLVNATPGTLQHALWNTVESWLKINAVSEVSKRLQKLQLTNRTFGLKLLDGNFCESECFYDGLRVGLTNFLPQRFLLKNPYDDKERPLLLVDVYRFGFLLGADVGVDFPSRFGIDAEINDELPQLRHQRIYEFIKVKPLDSIVDSVKNLKELSPLQVLKYGNIHLQLIENLQPGEALIASTYLSNAAGVQLSKYPFMARPLLSAGAELERVTVSRKALVRSEDKYLLQFSDLKATKFWLGLKGELLLVDFPLISLNIEKLSKMDLVFEFPASNEHHNLIEESLAASVPADSISNFSVVERSTETVKRKISRLLMPAKYFFDEIDATTIKMGGTEETHELHIAKVNKEQNFSFLPFYSSHNTTLESFVTADERVFIKLSMRYENLFGKRKHFKWVYRNMLPLLGKRFILFAPEDVNYYLDHFKFHGEVYVLPAGVERIIAYQETSTRDFCTAYANAAGQLYPRQWCEKMLNDNFTFSIGGSVSRDMREIQRFRSFAKRYVDAVQTWQRQPNDAMTTAERDKLMRDKAHKIAKVFSHGSFNPAVWKMLQRIAGEENVYRDGILTSRTGGLPGQSKVIDMPKALRGEAGSEVPAMFSDIVQSVQISTDPLFSELQNVFYEPMGEEDLQEDN